MIPEQNAHQVEKKVSIPGRAWFTEVPSTELLEMRGNEGLDLLQRISTNDLTKMEMGTWRQTILTNEKGRMVDVVWVGRKAEGLVFLLAEAHSAQKTREWIEKFIIMEDVQIVPPKQRFRHLRVIGKAALPADAAFAEFEHRWGEVNMRHILIPEEGGKETVKLLEERGAEKRSPQEYETFRIVSGIPLGNEISENFNPLEAGLGHLISWTKGCYVGQEVIARLDTYKKVQKHLVRLELSQGIGTVVPSPIKSTGGEVGMVTSVTIQEPFRGLGYVGTRQLETRDDLFVDGKSGQIQITVKE